MAWVARLLGWVRGGWMVWWEVEVEVSLSFGLGVVSSVVGWSGGEVRCRWTLALGWLWQGLA